MADFTSTTSFHLTSLPKAPSRVKFVEPFPLSSAGLNAGGHQFGNKNYKHGPRPKGRGLVLQRRNDAQRHSSRENPNVFMPEGASQVFRKQNSRRTLWLLEAEMKGASPEKASTLSTLMAQQQNRLGKLSRKHRRGKEGKRGSSRLRNPLQDPYAYTPERLAIWQRYVHDDCQTTRAAGFVWVRDCYFAEEWETSTEDLPVPEHQTLKDLLAHYMAARGNYVNLPRDRVCKDARRYLEAYYKVPLKPDSKELAKARVRMVREMILEGYFETSKTRGLEVSEFEEAQALLGLTPNVYKGEYSQGWRLLEPPVGANFYQMKNIEWKGVVNWSGVEVHKLPLRPAEDLPEMTESEDESMDSDIQESDDGDYIMDEDAFSEEEHFHQGGEADINEV